MIFFFLLYFPHYKFLLCQYINLESLLKPTSWSTGWTSLSVTAVIYGAQTPPRSPRGGVMGDLSSAELSSPSCTDVLPHLGSCWANWQQTSCSRLFLSSCSSYPWLKKPHETTITTESCLCVVCYWNPHLNSRKNSWRLWLIHVNCWWKMCVVKCF